VAARNSKALVTIQRVSLEGYYRVGATPTSRFEAFGRDVGIAPTRHFHSNQLMLNSYKRCKEIDANSALLLDGEQVMAELIQRFL